MVEATLARSDRPGVSQYGYCPERMWRDAHFFGAHALDAFLKLVPVDSVAITESETAPLHQRERPQRSAFRASLPPSVGL